VTGLAVDLAFWIFAGAAVWFGWRVFITDSMVRATFSLLASFLNVGAIMVLLLAEYLGVAMFFMMGVEMTVMAIFMVAFMMNPAGLNPMTMVHQARVAVGVGMTVGGSLILVVLKAGLDEVELVSPESTIRELGLELMGGSMLLMQFVGVTLAATMIGAVILSAATSRFGGSDEGSVLPLIDPNDQMSRPDANVAGNSGHGGMDHTGMGH
jgi:NADH:ubiquinone oxidoreductase subunit 6 (subunit J)